MLYWYYKNLEYIEKGMDLIYNHRVLFKIPPDMASVDVSSVTYCRFKTQM